MISVSTVPLVEAKTNITVNGFDKGPSCKTVVPIKKVTMVNFDRETLLDDYAYLASVPTSVLAAASGTACS